MEYLDALFSDAMEQDEQDDHLGRFPPFHPAGSSFNKQNYNLNKVKLKFHIRQQTIIQFVIENLRIPEILWIFNSSLER